MAYTYTRTYTEQEIEIRDLNEKIFKEIKKTFEGKIESDYQYKALSEEGNILEDKPMDLYDAGVLIGNDFCIYKGEGFVHYPGSDINYVYKDEIGEIHSFGKDYNKCYVIFSGNNKLDLLDFANHPEVKEFIEKVSKKIDGQELEMGPKI
jgi:hypothetical protein